MLHFFVCRSGADAIARYLKSAWGSALAPSVRLAYYDAPHNLDFAYPGTYVMAGVEGLGWKSLQDTADRCQALAALGDRARVLNHPTRLRRRYELLRALYERGLHAGNVYYLDEGRMPARYPVCLQRADAPFDPEAPWLEDPAAVASACQTLRDRGVSFQNVFALELGDVRSPDGLYRLYSALKVGDRLVAQRLLVGRRWGDWQSAPDRALPEALAYLRCNPHGESLQEIFRLARIDYGRVDYCWLGDRPQVWGIDTNPELLPGEGTLPEEGLQAYHTSLRAAWEALLAETQLRLNDR